MWLSIIKIRYKDLKNFRSFTIDFLNKYLNLTDLYIMNNTELELKRLEVLENIHELPKPKEKPKTISTKRVSQRQFFIDSFVKENIFMEYLPLRMKEGYTIYSVKSLAAQITYKILTTEQLGNVEKQYEAMSDQQLKHLKDM